MRRTRILLSVVAILLPALVAGSGEALAQAPAISAGLILQGSRTTDGLVYMWDNTSRQKDPIKIIVSLENVGGPGVLVPSGFSGKSFFLDLVFTDPDGKGIMASGACAGSDSGPHVPPVHVIHVQGTPVQVQPVERLPGTGTPPELNWGVEIALPDVHTCYSLSKPGRYSVKAVIPVTTYQGVDYNVAGVDYATVGGVEWTGTIESTVVNFAIVDDGDCDGYFAPEGCVSCPPAGRCSPTLEVKAGADCDDLLAGVHPGATEIPCNGRDDDCIPEDPPELCSVPQGTIALTAEKHSVGAGSYPGSNKVPLRLPVGVFDKSSGSCAALLFGVSWQNYKNIFTQCPSVVVPLATTDAAGKATLSVPPGDYLLIGMHDPDPAVRDDEVYIGNSVGILAADTTVQKYLQVIVKANGKNVPGKYTVRTGSELIVLEPEYIEWTGTQELYPFIFQSVGDWGVTTSITPPEGFVADYKQLGTEVNGDLKAIQFLVTDVGSDWVDTKVEHRVKHKNKTEVIKSRIGVRKKE